MDTVEGLPITPVGAGALGVLTLIIIYLLRHISNIRKDDAQRLIAIDEENDRRLAAERIAHEREISWCRDDRDEERRKRREVEAELIRMQAKAIAGRRVGDSHD